MGIGINISTQNWINFQRDDFPHRFIEELTTFDDFQLPESTLVLVEPFLKKPTFEPEAMAEKTQNSACGALCKWVRGVVRSVCALVSFCALFFSEADMARRDFILD